MKISLVTKITEYAKGYYPNWVNGGAFERLAMQEGYKAANSGRRCRELCAAKKLERRLTLNGVVEYRWNPNYSPPEEKEKSMYEVPRKKEKRFVDREAVDRINKLDPFVSSRGQNQTNKLF